MNNNNHKKLIITMIIIIIIIKTTTTTHIRHSELHTARSPRPRRAGGGHRRTADWPYGQFSRFHVCFCGLDPGNLKFETVRTNKQHICF